MKIAMALLFALQVSVSAAFAAANEEFKKGDLVLLHVRNEIAHMQVTLIDDVDADGIHTSSTFIYDERNIRNELTVDATRLSRLLPLDPNQNLEVLLPDNKKGLIERIFSNGVAQVRVNESHRQVSRLFYLEELRRLGQCETLLLPEWRSLITTTQK